MKVLCERELAYISGGNAQDTVYGNPGATSSNPSTWGPSASYGYNSSSEAGGYAEGGPASQPATCLVQVTGAGVTAANQAYKTAVYLGQPQAALPAAAIVGSGVALYSMYSLPACNP